MSLLVDRQSGRCIVTTAWETEEAMRASADDARQLRDRAAEAFGGTVDKVEGWEIAVLHRDHMSRAGACVRATWAKADPAQMDQSMEYYRTTILPALENLDGFCSASLLVDRSSGRGVSSVTFDSREAMERHSAQATAVKNQAIRDANLEESDEREFELALAHLRVPESV